MNEQTLALHGLAIKKHGDAAGVAQITGLSEETVTKHLEAAAQAGRVNKAGEKYMLAPTAAISLQSGYSRDFAEQRANAEMNAAYDDFETVNDQVKQLITDWQTMEVGGERLPNDHSDKDYDAAIIDRLGDLHEKAEPVLDRLIAHVPRLKVYKDMLLEALERAEDGAIEWVSDAKIMSYHTVWFELHEDLLRILGRERVE